MIWTKAANGMRYHSKKRSPRLSTNSQVQSEAQHFWRISAQVRFAKAPLGTLQVFCHTKCTRPCSGSPPAPQDGDKDEVTAAGATHHPPGSISDFLQPRISGSTLSSAQTHLQRQQAGELGPKSPWRVAWNFFGLLLSIFNKS